MIETVEVMDKLCNKIDNSNRSLPYLRPNGEIDYDVLIKICEDFEGKYCVNNNKTYTTESEEC